jgi:S1-C subfamily serine protease
MAYRLLQRYRTPLTAIGGALLGVVVVLAYLRIDPPAGRYDDAEIQRLADERIAAITPVPPVEPEIYSLVRPSVVQITKQIRGPSGQTGSKVGSGVVVDLNGTILTSYHVIAGEETVTVHFFDGTTALATVDQTLPQRDLATLLVRGLPNGVTAATLAGGVQPGDKVLAIGSPFGLDGSVSSGIVSALGRTFVVEETKQVLNGMIQFDAAVNPGNSGGPLVDLNGRVVGIVSGIVNPTQQQVFIGLAFAVPIEASSGIVAPLG